VHTFKCTVSHAVTPSSQCSPWHVCYFAVGILIVALLIPAILNNLTKESDHGCKNPTVGNQWSKSFDLSRTPTLPELLNFPCKERNVNIPVEIGSDYLNFGTLLLNDIKGARMRVIADKYREDGKTITIEILREWLGGRGKQPVTWWTFIEVLKDAGFSELAKDIELRCITTT